MLFRFATRVASWFILAVGAVGVGVGMFSAAARAAASAAIWDF